VTASHTPAPDLTEPGFRPDRVVDPARLIEQATWLLYIDGKRAGELGQQALVATEHQPTHALRGDAWFHVGYALLRAGQTEAALDANERARASYTAHGNQRGLLMCDEFDGLHLRSIGRLREALELHLRIASRTDVVRAPTDLYITHNSRALTRKLLGQSDAMLLDFYQALGAAQTCDSPGPNINALVNLGGSHGDLYNLTEAQHLSEKALDLAEQAGAWNAFCVAAFNLTQSYDGLGLGERCAAVLERLRHNEIHMPPGILRQNTAGMAVAHLCAGDLEGTRAWLELGASAPFADGDGKTDFARAQACYLMAVGRDLEARKVVETRIAECALAEFQDQPYARMRLLQAATDACERLYDTSAALRYLHESHKLYEALVGRSSRAGFIAAQAAHDYAVARNDRDRAREAQEQAEGDRRRLAALNEALEERMRETERLNEALQLKIAEAEALQAQLREQAVRDPLTGLYNRRFLAEASAARIELARRQDTAIAIVLVDIDHFKQINDEHGHERGDEVLRRFAALLLERMRRSDVVCRFGGEEFLLLVDNCEEATLVEILDELLDRFRELRFGDDAAPLQGRTFSAGVAQMGADGHDFEALVRVADERMYRAKATGRARICRTSD
jgi:two-component system cell cycle response regulator